MDGVKKVTKRPTAHHASSLDHRRVQKSSTLNRKFVKKPVAVPKITSAAGAASRSLRQQGQRRAMLQKQNTVRLQPSQKIVQKQFAAKEQPQPQARAQARIQVHTRTSENVVKATQAKVSVAKKQVAVKNENTKRVMRQQIVANDDQGRQQQVQLNKTAAAARARMAARKAAMNVQPQHLSAQELKERAIQQALRKVDKIESDKGMAAQFVGLEEHKKPHFWQKKGFAIAASMAVVSIALLGYLVQLNLPDISVRVAAMQAGIEKIYPSYAPANYRLDGLVKEDAGRVTMNFKNDQGDKFTLLEEKSNWDSAAVLSNYVKKNWGSNYSIAKGQGLTIYVSDSNAAWVNGGVFYVITDDSGKLSASDLHDIAVSL